MNPAASPIPASDVHGDGRWMSMHNRFISETKEKEPDVIFIGDSILGQLVVTEMWERLFAPMHPLNFGVGGDQTQHVLWRVLNGELDNVSPKAIVILVGTNNHGHTPEQIQEGIMAVVTEARERQPQAYIIVLTLLPRGQHPNHLRVRNSSVNQLLAKSLPEVERAQLVNIDPGFIYPDGTITHHDMWDYLHLTHVGYKRAFEPVYDLLLQLLAEWEKEKEPELEGSTPE